MTQELRKITANRDKSIAIKRYDLHGRPHLVVPMVMLTEGVHKGSSGAAYYSKDELSRNVNAWDHKPVVVYHPIKSDGTPKTACDPNVLNNSQVGIILNTHYDGKLKAEAWLDEELTKKADERIIESIEKGEMTEISTGLYSDSEDVKGVWNNEKYDFKVKDFSPDHLAILPDQKGACSIADGAGLLRVNAAVKEEVAEHAKGIQSVLALNGIKVQLIGNELSFSDIESQLSRMLGSKFGEKGKSWYGYICHVFSDSVIFNDDKGGYCKIGYEVKDEKVSLVGDAVMVQRVIEYKPVNNSLVSNTENAMTKEEKKAHIDKLIGNGWEETDRPELEGMKDTVLSKIVPKAKEVPVTNKEIVVNKELEVKPIVETKQMTEEEFWKMAPPSLRMQHNQLQAAAEAQKKEIVQVILANANNPFTEEFLMAKTDINELRGMAMLCGGGPEPIPMFHGGAGGAPAPMLANRAAPVKQVALTVPDMWAPSAN